MAAQNVEKVKTDNQEAGTKADEKQLSEDKIVLYEKKLEELVKMAKQTRIIL